MICWGSFALGVLAVVVMILGGLMVGIVIGRR
jgi:uncharacterized membrane protein SpoIIM required for sporulation